MGLFSIIKERWSTPRIPKEIFIEEIEDEKDTELNNIENSMDDSISKDNGMYYRYGSINCRKALDDFLGRDFDSEGYRAALIDSDTSNMNSHVEILKLELQDVVDESLALYEAENRYYDVDIKIHTGLGIMDNVERLNVGKVNNVEVINRIKAMYAESLAGKGIGYIPILSFEQGFKRGISSRLF